MVKAVKGTWKINSNSAQVSISKWEKEWCLELDLKDASYNSAPSCISGKTGMVVHTDSGEGTDGRCGVAGGCSFTVIATCSGGKVYNGLSCACPSGQSWDSGGGSCILTARSPLSVCTGGQIYNSGTSSCECPTSKPNWDGTNCQVPCTGGRVWDSSSKSCECSSGNWNGTSCVVLSWWK